MRVNFYYQSYIDHLVDIQSSLKPVKKIEKICYDHFRIAESLKMMNRPNPTRTDQAVTLFNAYLETMRFSAT